MNLLFIALVAGCIYWLGRTEVTYTFGYLLGQPICQAFVFGLLFGDMATAMMIGVAIELVYVGVVATGAQFPADELLAGSIAIPIALASGMDPETAVMVAVPFGTLGALMDQLRRTIHSELAHICDRAAETGDDKKIKMAATVLPYIIGIPLRLLPVALIVYFGADVAQKVLDMLPAWVLNGISVAGGVMPAMGFALILMIIGRTSLMPFFFIGYFLVQYFHISTMTAAVFGLPLALAIVMMRRDNNKTIMEKVETIIEDE